MFLRRAIATLLLVTYGLPMVAGPSWHSHVGCGDASHVEAGHSEADHAHAGHVHSAPDSHHDACCDHPHEDEATDANLVRSGLLGATDQPSHLSDTCTICQFYAGASWTGLTESADRWCDSVAAPVPAFESPRCDSLLLWQARGPPFCC